MRQADRRTHMMAEVILNFGPAALSRMLCETCKEETLHLRGVCVHCSGQRERHKRAKPSSREARRSKPGSAWRRHNEIMCESRRPAAAGKGAG